MNRRPIMVWLTVILHVYCLAHIIIVNIRRRPIVFGLTASLPSADLVVDAIILRDLLSSHAVGIINEIPYWPSLYHYNSDNGTSRLEYQGWNINT